MRSLRVQLAVGSALLACGAVLLVALIAVVTVSISFDHYQSSQLMTDVGQVAASLGEGQGQSTSITGTRPAITLTPGPQGSTFGRFRVGVAYLLVMTPSGQLFTPTDADAPERSALAQDESTVAPALRRALHGATVEGSLPDGSLLLTGRRLYAAAPIRAGGARSGAIIGAVALVLPPRPDRTGAGVFLHDVNSIVLFGTLGAALLAALVAIVFSRRLTRPLGRFHEAAVRMAAGDYAVRVAIRSPTEYQQLAQSFNDMASALERDVLELHRQEQLRRELVANVSHELATPLTAIEGFTEALLDGVVHDPAAREDTARILAREAARLHRLVDQLRQVALFEAGTQALDRGAVDLQALTEDTLGVLAPEFEQKRITVARAFPDDLPPVFADGDRVTQILLNLLDNAIRYTPTGGHIEIEGTVANGRVRVGVANTGEGIASEHRERIFDRFYRADPSRSTATGGSGLGLAIVKALVEAHGGAVGIEERTGGGVCFTFTLPLYSGEPIAEREARVALAPLIVEASSAPSERSVDAV